MASVIIENPAFSANRFTSLRAAERYIRKGRARWTVPGRKLRFLEDDHRHASAQEQAHARNTGYDRRGLLTLDEIKRLPASRPVVLVTIPKKSRVAPPMRHGKVRTLLQADLATAA